MVKIGAEIVILPINVKKFMFICKKDEKNQIYENYIIDLNILK